MKTQEIKEMKEILETIIRNENDCDLELENGLRIIKTKRGKIFNIKIGDYFSYEYCSCYCNLKVGVKFKGFIDFLIENVLKKQLN